MSRPITPRAAFLLAFVAACDSTEPPGPPAGAMVVGSATVSVAAGATVADSLAIKAVDKDGRAVPNAQVTWMVAGPAGVATIAPGGSTTDRSGVARAALKGGTVAGSATVLATLVGAQPPLTVPFGVTVNPGPVTQLTAPATTTMGTGVTRALLTARDQYGNAAPLTGVTLTSSNTAVATVSATGSVTSVALGATTITAQAGTVSAQTRVWVVPAAINVCETNTATLCSNWTLADSLYNATWEQGSQAVIRVGHFSADSVRFNRTDPAGNSTGMTAVYRGTVASRAVPNGGVTWTQPTGGVINGTWTGTW